MLTAIRLDVGGCSTTPRYTASGARLGTIPLTCESVDISTAAALALASAASATGEQLIEFGQVQRAILGISYLERAPTESESERGGLPLVKEGIVVLEVPKGSPGAEAGLQAVQRPATPQSKPTIGDVIVSMNGDDHSAEQVQARHHGGPQGSARIDR